jgi:hypothetical protein
VPVVRLGTADGQGRPHVVVVTFAVDGDTIYTAVDQKPKSGSTLKRLRNVGENPMVTISPTITPTIGKRCGGFAPMAGRRS